MFELWQLGMVVVVKIESIDFYMLIMRKQTMAGISVDLMTRCREFAEKVGLNNHFSCYGEYCELIELRGMYADNGKDIIPIFVVKKELDREVIYHKVTDPAVFENGTLSVLSQMEMFAMMDAVDAARATGAAARERT